MWRRFLMIGLGCAFGVILLTQSAWATEPALTEEFKTKWQNAQDRLTGQWTKVMVYKGEPYEGKRWRRAALEIEPYGIIKRGLYEKLNGERIKITKGKLVYIPGVAIMGIVKAETGVYYVDRGAIVGNKMILGLYDGTVDELVREDMKSDLKMLSMPDLNAKSVRNVLARYRVSEDRAFPNMTVDQP